MSGGDGEPDDDEGLEAEFDEYDGLDGDPHDEEELDREIDSDATVSCPYCGEATVISLDHGSGAVQEYVEDCEVCCRPWRVLVRYDRSGAASVSIEPAQ